LEGSVCGIFRVLFLHLLGGTEKNLEKSLRISGMVADVLIKELVSRDL
jgi:hypothetical protein